MTNLLVNVAYSIGLVFLALIGFAGGTLIHVVWL